MKMNKLLLLLIILISVLGCTQKKVPQILVQNYSFLTDKNSTHKIVQSNDTLINRYYYKGVIDSESFNEILETRILDRYIILKLKKLDSIPESENLCPEKIYSIAIIKNLTDKQLKYDYLTGCLTKNQLDTVTINKTILDKVNCLTYYSDSYLDDLSTFKKASTIDDFRIIFNSIEDNDFDAGKIQYSAEQLNKSCIKNGYDPVETHLRIDSLMWNRKK